MAVLSIAELIAARCRSHLNLEMWEWLPVTIDTLRFQSGPAASSAEPGRPDAYINILRSDM
jgi:hypothetical protein